MVVSTPLAVQVLCNEDSKIFFAGSGPDALPKLRMSLGIEITISELIKALGTFQRDNPSSGPLAKQPAAENQHALPPHPSSGPMIPGLQGETSAHQAAAPVATGLSAQQLMAQDRLGKQAAGPGTNEVSAVTGAGNSLAAQPQIREVRVMQTVTWDNEIADLQPGYEEYMKRTKWEPIDPAHSPIWFLHDDACLRNFTPIPLQPPPLVKKLPVGLSRPGLERGSVPVAPPSVQDAMPVFSGQPGEGSAAGDIGAANEVSGSANEAFLQRGSERQPMKSRNGFSGEEHKPPDTVPPPPPGAAPPPPPTSAAAAQGTGGPVQPPGLAPPPPNGANQGGQGQKECKQQ